MGKIQFKNVNKIYPNGFHAIHDFNLTIDEGEFIVFVGPSGCGKSTVLRMLGGLEQISSGEVILDGKVVNKCPPVERDIAIVFQDYALYSNMSVYENVGISMKVQHEKDTVILDKVLEAADTVEITEYLNRLPKQLSGGQKQRVALARAIVRKPKAFLMDEPLSNLDAKLRNSTRIEIVRLLDESLSALDYKLRKQMQIELKRLQKKLGITFIYVTHDQTEAMTMADRIVVMKEGVIQQVGTPQEIYAAPVNLFVASFIGTPQMNFIPGKLSETGFENESFRLSLPDALKAKLRSSIGKEVILGLRPEALAVSEGIQENTIPVRLEEVEYMGRYQIVHAMVGGSSLVLSVPSDVKINPEFYVSLSMDKAHFFDGETTRSLLCREVEENHA